MRDEGLLRLFFADALAPEEQLTLIRRLRESDEAAADWMREEIITLADAAEQAGTSFPAIVARLSADIYTYAANWLTELERELEAQPRTDPATPDTDAPPARN